MSWLQNTQIAFIEMNIQPLIYATAMWFVFMNLCIYTFFVFMESIRFLFCILNHLLVSVVVICAFISSIDDHDGNVAWNFVSELTKSYNSSVTTTIWSHFTHYVRDGIAGCEI